MPIAIKYAFRRLVKSPQFMLLSIWMLFWFLTSAKAAEAKLSEFPMMADLGNRMNAWSEGRSRSSKTYFHEEVAYLEGLIAAMPAKDRDRLLREVEVSFDEEAGGSEDKAIRELVSIVYVRWACKTGDDCVLKRILVVNPSDYIFYQPLEYYIVENRGVDGAMILTDAYTDNTRAAATVIVESLARALPDVRKEFAEDRDFVSACKRWLEAHRKTAKLNRDYPWIYEPSRQFAKGAAGTKLDGVPNETVPGLFQVRDRSGKQNEEDAKHPTVTK